MSVVSAPGEGERLVRPGRVLLAKLALRRLALSEFALEPGVGGPGPHVHRRHVDAFYVVEGTLDVRLGAAWSRAATGTLVVAPPGAVHTFANRSDERVRFLNVHAPDPGFHEYVRCMDALSARGEEIPQELHERYDVFETETGDVEPVVAHGAGRIAFEQAGVILTDFRAGMVIRPHVHREHADAFSVLGGELQARIGDERFVAAAGTALAVEPGVVHAFVAGAAGARVLNVHAPDCGFVDSGGDSYFVENGD